MDDKLEKKIKNVLKDVKPLEKVLNTVNGI